jgi:hypothetical protein
VVSREDLGDEHPNGDHRVIDSIPELVLKLNADPKYFHLRQ